MNVNFKSLTALISSLFVVNACGNVNSANQSKSLDTTSPVTASISFSASDAAKEFNSNGPSKLNCVLYQGFEKDKDGVFKRKVIAEKTEPLELKQEELGGQVVFSSRMEFSNKDIEVESYLLFSASGKDVAIQLSAYARKIMPEVSPSVPYQMMGGTWLSSVSTADEMRTFAKNSHKYIQVQAVANATLLGLEGINGENSFAAGVLSLDCDLEK